MANTKISALTALTGANVDMTADVFALVDTSVTTTKKILGDQLALAIETKGSDVASASSPDIWTVGQSKHITGTTTITGFAAAGRAGMWRKLIFDGAVLISDGANLVVPGGDYTTAADDVVFVFADTTTKFYVAIIKADGTPVARQNMNQITNSLGADVALNNVSNYFTGPTVAQGSTGTWFASGTVSLIDTTAVAGFDVKLWDGTTVIASARAANPSTGVGITVSLSGYLASPAGNIRISVRDVTSTGGTIRFNGTGESKDSTLSAIRIG